MKLFYPILILSFIGTISCLLNFVTVEQWKQIEFKFPTTRALQRARSLGYYIKGNSLILDIHVRNNGSTIYAALPRLMGGVPFTLATVANTNGPLGPQLLPYPSYFWHNNQGVNCDGLTSVFSLYGDSCNRLWAIDSGKIGDQQKCPPQLVAFDMNTNLLVYRYIFDTDMVPSSSLLSHIAVDVLSLDNNCANTYVYVSDVLGNALIVVNTDLSISWKVSSYLMSPNPVFGIHTIAGVSFPYMGGIHGTALSPNEDGVPSQNLYFTAFASNTIQYIDSSILRNYSFFLDSDNDINDHIVIVPGNRQTQTVSMAFDPSNRLYFGLYNPISMVRWPKDSGSHSPANFETVGDNADTLQFLGSVKIFRGPNRFQVWTVSSRYQIYATSGYSDNEVNVRIMRASITDI